MSDKEKKEAVPKRILRRERERKQRYESILKIAENLFARTGYHQTSMDKIANESEVSVGTVYFYFKNKEDLLINLLEEIGFELRNLLGDEFKKENHSLKGLERVGHFFFKEYCMKFPEKTAILLRESVGQSPLVEEKRKNIFEKLISDVKDALNLICKNIGGTFQSELSSDVMAVSITGMFESVAYKYLIWQERTDDLKVISDDAVAFIIGGVKNLIKNI
ncbi:MAG: TetR/AcrR family transcriptional regulator [Desulfobacterales bacterium]|nr:TetR/AcrR family transcriptional regulator [Desulfobacterales bacterium]